MRNRYKFKNSERLEKYFSYNSFRLDKEEIIDFITPDSVAKAEHYLLDKDIEDTNIYFKLLEEIEYLEKDFENNKKILSHLYYIIGERIGLIIHPSNGNAVGIHYINKAIELETDEEKIKEYKETISLVNEEP